MVGPGGGIEPESELDVYSAIMTVNAFQDYGLDVNAFRELVTDCPQRLLELSASCCMVGRQKTLHIKIQ